MVTTMEEPVTLATTILMLVVRMSLTDVNVGQSALDNLNKTITTNHYVINKDDVRVSPTEGITMNKELDSDDIIELGLQPIFDTRSVNITAMAGDSVTLPCSVKHIGIYKVVWLDENSIPLTYEDRRVVDDPRFGVIRSEISRWDLQVRDVRREDSGHYRCTINLSPVRIKLIRLSVNVPVRILDHLSSDDIVAKEHDDVTLDCNAAGEPRPTVTWYRKTTPSSFIDQQSVIEFGEHGFDTKTKCDVPEVGDAGSRHHVAGMSVKVSNISRDCSGIYQCVADNGLSPPVSRLVHVSVEFAPEISLPNKRIFQSRDRETILECLISANPHASNYWEKNNQLIVSSSKLRIEAYDSLNAGDSHTLTLSLQLRVTESSDFGEYKCVAANRFGRTEASMFLYELAAETTNLSRSHDELRQPTTSGRVPARIGKSPDQNVHNDVTGEHLLQYALRDGQANSAFKALPLLRSIQIFMWAVAFVVAEAVLQTCDVTDTDPDAFS